MSKYGLTRYIICLYVVNIWQSAAMQFVAKKGRNLCNLWLDKMALPPHSCLSTSVFILKILVWSIFHGGLRSLLDTFNLSINNSTISNFVSIVIFWNMTFCFFDFPRGSLEFFRILQNSLVFFRVPLNFLETRVL